VIFYQRKELRIFNHKNLDRFYQKGIPRRYYAITLDNPFWLYLEKSSIVHILKNAYPCRLSVSISAVN